MKVTAGSNDGGIVGLRLGIISRENAIQQVLTGRWRLVLTSN